MPDRSIFSSLVLDGSPLPQCICDRKISVLSCLITPPLSGISFSLIEAEPYTAFIRKLRGRWELRTRRANDPPLSSSDPALCTWVRTREGNDATRNRRMTGPARLSLPLHCYVRGKQGIAIHVYFARSMSFFRCRDI